MHKIILVEDHFLMAQAISQVIEKNNQYKVLKICRNGKELMQLLTEQKLSPDLIMLDINMPVMNGFETAEWLQEEFPKIKFITLTMNDDEASLIKMFTLGAKGYILKDADEDHLLDAIRIVIKDGFYFSEHASQILFGAMNFKQNKLSSAKPEIQLREKEIELLKWSCTELTYKEIAAKMNLSPKTIDGYRESIFEKLELHSRVGMAVYAIRHGIFKI